MAEENRLFQVEIITPDRVFYTGEGDMICLLYTSPSPRDA